MALEPSTRRMACTTRDLGESGRTVCGRRCDRVRLSSDVSEIKIAFGIPPDRPSPNFAASWNVAPTDPLPLVRYDAKEHQRSLDIMRCRLIPY